MTLALPTSLFRKSLLDHQPGRMLVPDFLSSAYTVIQSSCVSLNLLSSDIIWSSVIDKTSEHSTTWVHPYKGTDTVGELQRAGNSASCKTSLDLQEPRKPDVETSAWKY